MHWMDYGFIVQCSDLRRQRLYRPMPFFTAITALYGITMYHDVVLLRFIWYDFIWNTIILNIVGRFVSYFWSSSRRLQQPQPQRDMPGLLHSTWHAAFHTRFYIDILIDLNYIKSKRIISVKNDFSKINLNFSLSF